MTNFNERTNTLLYKIYPSHFILKRVDVGCVWEMSWRRRHTAILTPGPSDHSSTSSSSWLGCSTVGHWGPKALVVRERWARDGDRPLFDPSSSLTIAALHPHLGWGCLTVGHWGPKPSLWTWFSLHWHPVFNWLEPPQPPGYIIVSCPPASAGFPLIYSGAPLDWRLGRGSICYTSPTQYQTQYLCSVYTLRMRLIFFLSFFSFFLGDRCRGWLEGSLFDRYYTKV